ncbi:putative transferase CAF17 homolog, mitochondrial [Actinia tenebrosa]|uniref:Transferase CAF17 homolog, mitochondrial n=1 Tax=Actinia tenebrosa TaxID=6105 RepID=A0A6P8H5M3_ACTTE|nr:putative transferase CAF17 homolog, mitochondrial [Actinia tenebrosa]
MAARGVKFNIANLPRFTRVNHQLFFRRTAHNLSGDSLKYCQLEKRSLIRVHGADSVRLLQGLVTNSVELFHQDGSLKTMYSMFLNAQGRVLYDAMLYKDKTNSGNPCFLVECDKNTLPGLLKLMTFYKLRSKVDISRVADIVPWVIFNEKSSDTTNLDVKMDSNLISFGRDPRIKELGWRLLLTGGCKPSDLLDGIHGVNESSYDIYRVKLGVCEGASEIQPGTALPLEYNLDYINGVSFQKGCYIGQELTARTHHTGVIRKRVMPFKFAPVEEVIKLEQDMAIKTSSGKTSGKLCVVYKGCGLAVMRIAMLNNNKHYVKDNEGNDVEIHPYVPKWWPE